MSRILVLLLSFTTITGIRIILHQASHTTNDPDSRDWFGNGSNLPPSHRRFFIRGITNLEKGKGKAKPPRVSEFSSPVRVQPPNPRCAGKYIHIYEMPRELNAEIAQFSRRMYKFIPTCPDVSNSGFGKPAFKPSEILSLSSSQNPTLVPPASWYRTDQFSLESIFHARLKTYPCLTRNREEASLFYVPYFAGMAICSSLFTANVSERDRTAKMAVDWLEKQDTWHRQSGRDHIVVLGRVVWDFLREEVHSTWGNTFMNMSHMRNVRALGIEGSPLTEKYGRIQGIPYPTSFHPNSLADIKAWQTKISRQERSKLVIITGSPHGMGGRIREQLFELCKKNRADCTAVICKGARCLHPDKLMPVYSSARFCFQPPGDTPTRKGLFDCMLAGAIPVVFSELTSHKQYTWHLPAHFSSYSVYIPEEEFWQTNGTTVFPTLKSIPSEVLRKMTDTVISLIPRLVYSSPDAEFLDDAFTLTIQKVLEEVAK